MFTYIITATLSHGIVLFHENVTGELGSVDEFVAEFVPAFKEAGPKSSFIMTDEEITELSKSICKHMKDKKSFSFTMFGIVEFEFKHVA